MPSKIDAVWYFGGSSMRKLMAAVDRFCYNHPNFGIPNLMTFIIGGNVIVYLMDMFSNGTFSGVLSFIPAYILKGEVWRLLSFIFVPENSGGVIFFAVMLYFYYFIGTALERHWGTARFNVFYFTGVLATIIVGLIIGAAGGGLGSYIWVSATMYYVNLSLFFAFATLYPDMQVLLFFVLPVKIKWLAYLDLAVFIMDIIQNVAAGAYLHALLPVFAFANYLLFFGDDLISGARRNTRQVKHQTSRQTINFKKAVKETQQSRGYLHKCCVCGRTDTDYPDLEFRYCSRCAGYRCYCMDHINNHVHVTED